MQENDFPDGQFHQSTLWAKKAPRTNVKALLTIYLWCVWNSKRPLQTWGSVESRRTPDFINYLIWNFPPNAFLRNIVHTQNIKCSFSFLLLSNKHRTLKLYALCTQKNTHRRFSVSEVLGDSELLHLSLCFSPDRCNFLHQRAAPSKYRGFPCPGKWSVDCPRRQTRGIH